MTLKHAHLIIYCSINIQDIPASWPTGKIQHGCLKIS